MNNEDEIPWWVIDNQGSVAKGLWEQAVIKEICLTLPKDQAELIVVGYMNGDKQCQEFFDRMSHRLPQSEQRPGGWRRLSSLT